MRPGMRETSVLLAAAALFALAASRAEAEDAAPARESQEELSRELSKLEMRGVRNDPETLARLDYLESALESVERRLELRRFRAECRRRAGELDAAMDEFRAVATHPGATDFLRLLAQRSIAEATWTGSSLEEAEFAFRDLIRALQTAPRTSSDRNYLDLLSLLEVSAAHHHASVLQGLGRAEDAIAEYERAIRLNTPERREAVDKGFTNARAMLNIATLAESLGMKERAVQALEEVRSLDPTFYAPYIDHKFVQFMSLPEGSPERTEKLEAILARYPADPWCTVIEVSLYYELSQADQPARARAHLDAAIRRGPAPKWEYGGVVTMFEVEAWCAHLDLLISEKKPLEAEHACKTVMERYADDPRAKLVPEYFLPQLAELRQVGEATRSAPESVASRSGGSGGTRWMRIGLFGGVNACVVAAGIWWFRLRRASEVPA